MSMMKARTMHHRGWLFLVRFILVACIRLSACAAARTSSFTGLRLVRRLEDNNNANTSAVPYQVELFLALYYVNDKVAVEFETKTPSSSEAVSHFCQAVNTQASGKQVTDATELIGAVVETRVIDADAGDYECQILQVNRRYDNDGEDLLGQGYFILEVALEQVVYVTSPDPLSEDEVASFIITGFSRGSGGRVRFRRLLQAHPAFMTILNTEVLKGGALSPPQAAPTSAPSLMPTAGPTPSPTLPLTATPTLPLTATPTLFPNMTPSVTPSLTPSFHPSTAPSGVPTVGEDPSASPSSAPPVTLFLPTSAPSLRPTRAPTVNNGRPSASSQDDKERDRQPLILGAIAGGIATILVSCFFIFCVWFPFCGKHDNEEAAHPSQHQQQQQGSRQRYNANVSHGSERISAMMIPGMVQLDEDHQSVADTSIGDGTAGGAFRTRLTVTNIAAPIKAPPLLHATNGIQNLDSFDESSLYTSTTSQVGGGAPLKPNITSYSGPIDVDALEDDDDDEEEEYDATAQNLLGDFVDDDEVSESYPFFGIKKGARENASPRDTKGFDPFEDRSALGSTLESSTLPSAVGSTLGSALESTLDVASSSCSSSSRDDEEGKTAQSVAESDYQFSEVVVDSPPRPRSRAENNSLLRAVLEDARLMSQSKSPSSKSRLSYKSAPARVVPRRSKRGPHPHDLLADNYELEEALSSASSSSSFGSRPSSVGAIPVTPPRVRGKRADQKTRSRATLRDLIYGSRATRENDKIAAGEESPSRDGDDMSNVIGAQPRHKWLSPSEEKASEVDTPASSPGVLGINEVPKMLDDVSPVSAGVSNHWVLESIEQVLDPRSLSGDVESTNGKSFQSGTSRNSYGSRRSHKYAARSGFESDLDRFLSKSPASAPSTSPLINGENNDGVEQITPRTLEHDLKRLEMELAEVLQPDNDQTTTSSFTASSAGASRSTRSSRLTAKRSRRKRIVVVVPAGKLGIVLADRHDGKGTVVSEVRSSSAMSGMISPGDKLVAVDGEDVSKMVVSEITDLMSARAHKERRLTVVTSSKNTKRSLLQETKQES